VKFEPRLPRTDVNVTPRHPVKEGMVMLLGLLVIGGAFLGLASLLVDRIVPYVPRSWEARLLPAFEEIRFVPVTEEERIEQECLESLLARLLEHWEREPFELRVGLLNEDEPNALAFPGGLILVTRGLMKQVESENELAFVLGHEIGHFQNRDHLKGLGRGLAFTFLFAILSPSGSGGDMVALSGEIAQRGFSREQEVEADAFGLSLVVAEFGHLEGATDFFERIPAPENVVERSLGTYLSTHPLSEERVEDITRLAEEKGWLLEGELTPVPWGAEGAR
jgi:predicted Zn-dependent protease